MRPTTTATPPVAPLDTFVQSLATWHSPSFLRPLGHVVDPRLCEGLDEVCEGLDEVLAPVIGTLDSLPGDLDPATAPDDMPGWPAGRESSSTVFKVPDGGGNACRSG